MTYTLPAPLLPLQRAVPAWLADAYTVLYLSAGLSFRLARAAAGSTAQALRDPVPELGVCAVLAGGTHGI